jgi:hypothetical protein
LSRSLGSKIFLEENGGVGCTTWNGSLSRTLGSKIFLEEDGGVVLKRLTQVSTSDWCG